MTESPRGLDLAALAAYLTDAAPGLLTEPLHAALIAGGKSNLTYIVGDRTRDVIVRRPPLGHVLATAHDMRREYRVITALAPTAVPVPTTYAICPDDSVLGAPFFVMERAIGTPYRLESELSALGEDRTRDITERLLDTLVALHAIDPAAVGLSDLGRPEGFLARQVSRWGKQYAASTSRDLPDADRLRDALATQIPQEGAPAIVHGDYRLDNVLVDSTDRITAVLDWEMATLGDPLTDVGIMAVYQQVGDIAPAIVTDAERITYGELNDRSDAVAAGLIEAGLPAIVTDAAKAPGYLSVRQLQERYAVASGRDLSQMGWYTAMAWYKLGVILEGIHYRYHQGHTVGDGFADMGNYTPALFAAGLAALNDR